MSSLENAVNFYNMLPTDLDEMVALSGESIHFDNPTPPKYLFIDLDETLISADYHNDGKTRTKVTFNWMGQPEWYGVILKEGVIELLAAARAKYENVYILTAATTDYAIEMCRTFSLGFKPEEILAREHVDDLHNLTTRVDIHSVLIDNQYSNEPNAVKKIRYLKTFGKVGYVKMREFFGHSNQVFDKAEIDSVMQSIEEQFKALE